MNLLLAEFHSINVAISFNVTVFSAQREIIIIIAYKMNLIEKNVPNMSRTELKHGFRSWYYLAICYFQWFIFTNCDHNRDGVFIPREQREEREKNLVSRTIWVFKFLTK